MRFRENPAALLSIFYAAFILYGTMIPFDLTTDPDVIARGIDTIRWLPLKAGPGIRGSLPDIVTNFLLFVPFGALIAYAGFRSNRKPSRWSTVVLSIVAAAALSSFVEALQICSPTRVTSLTDLLTNTVGALAGIILSFVYFRWARGPLQAWTRHEILRSPEALLLIVYSAMLVLGALAPFDISMDVSYVKQGLKTARLDPMTDPTPWPKMLGNMLWFAGLCYLICHLLSTRFRRLRNILTILTGFVIAASLTIGLELGQILVASRVATTRDVLAGLLGVVYGLLAFCLVNPSILTGNRPDRGPRSGRGLFWLILVHYLIYVTHEALYPYTFHLPPEMSGVIHGTLLPFSAYYGKTNVLALFDFLGGIGRYVPLGFLVQGSRFTCKVGSKWRAVAVCLSLATVLEVMQLGVAGRYADISDVIAAGCGGYLGWLAQRWWREKRSEMMP